jgi:iron complex outermembrane recepter protein
MADRGIHRELRRLSNSSRGHDPSCPAVLAVGPGLALALALSLCSPLGAQVADTVRTDTVRAPVFQVPGLTVLVPRPASTTGGASAVEVAMDSLMARPAPTLEQVLRDLPLIQIRRNSRGEAQPALRGGEDRQIAVLMDGVPLTLGWDGRADLSVIPLTAAQRVDLVRGLSSVLYGPNVLGGAVEIDVARGAARQARPLPLQVDLGLDHALGRSVGVSGGALMDTPGGEWVLRGGGGLQSREGDVLSGRAGKGDGQDPSLLTKDGDLRLNTDVHRLDAFVAGRYRSLDGNWLAISSSGFTLERGVAPEAHLASPRLWRYPRQSRIITALSAGTAHTATAWGEGDMEASLGLDVGSYRIDEYTTPEYRERTGGETGDDLTVTLRFLGDHSLGERGELRGAFTYGDVNHVEGFPGRATSRYRQRLWSMGTEAEWLLTSGGDAVGRRNTRVTVGAVLDGADTPRSGDKPPLGRLWDWGGRLGATSLGPDQRVLFHGALSRRTRFPALRELYSGALGRFLPNPDLRPEVLTGGELGVTVKNRLADLQVVGFHQRLTDGIVRTSVVTGEGARFRRINQGEVRSTGLEILALGWIGPAALTGDLTLQRVRGISPDGTRGELEYEPEVAGRLALRLPVAWAVEGSANLRYVGRQFCENPEVGGLQSLRGSRTLDLGLRRAFGRAAGFLSRTEALISLDNVTDGLVLDQCGLPQPGRTLRVHLRLR